jgi:hypothetical protein
MLRKCRYPARTKDHSPLVKTGCFEELFAVTVAFGELKTSLIHACFWVPWSCTKTLSIRNITGIRWYGKSRKLTNSRRRCKSRATLDRLLLLDLFPFVIELPKTCEDSYLRNPKSIFLCHQAIRIRRRMLWKPNIQPLQFQDPRKAHAYSRTPLYQYSSAWAKTIQRQFVSWQHIRAGVQLQDTFHIKRVQRIPWATPLARKSSWDPRSPLSE